MSATRLMSGRSLRFLAARHGESKDNEANTFGRNVGLTPLGVEEAEKLGAELLGRVGLVLHSPSLRAKETAEIIRQTSNLEIVECKGLASRRWGELTGCSSSVGAQWKAEHPGTADRPPGGESDIDLVQRVSRAIEQAVRASRETSYGIIAHKGVLRVLALMIDGVEIPSPTFVRGQVYAFEAFESMFLPLDFDGQTPLIKAERY